MKIKFCGAAKMVTGSCYLVSADSEQFIVDCGLFQGSKDDVRLNYMPFQFDPKRIRFLLLTHAHLDHSGLIPKLLKNGFKGRIYATSPTIDLCKVMLEDSAHIQEEETEAENRRRVREGLMPRKPLYTIQDARDSFPLFEKIEYNRKYDISKNVGVAYRDAGHIIGSAIIEVFLRDKGKEKKIVFSGDLGQWGTPIINDPTLIDNADYVLIESTYGDRVHEDIGIRDDLLLKYVKSTYKKGGKLLIPSFAIERTQELLYSFTNLSKRKDFPKQPIFLDSPLAIKATEIFKRHKECYDEEALKRGKNIFNMPSLEYTPKASDSMKINDFNKQCIVIAGSGMCTGGRIRHHLKHGLWNPKNTVLFVGFQAKGTLGRYILEGAKEVRMMGIKVIVKADIEKINSFSAHADSKDLMRWVDGFKAKPSRIFVVHGEGNALEALKAKIQAKGIQAFIPDMNDEVSL